MTVHVDQTRDNGLAGEINARRARRRLDLALSADGRESTVLDNEGRTLDRRASIARDQPRAFEQSCPIALRQANRHNDHTTDQYFQSAHKTSDACEDIRREFYSATHLLTTFDRLYKCLPTEDLCIFANER